MCTYPTHPIIRGWVGGGSAHEQTPPTLFLIKFESQVDADAHIPHPIIKSESRGMGGWRVCTYTYTHPPNPICHKG